MHSGKNARAFFDNLLDRPGCLGFGGPMLGDTALPVQLPPGAVQPRCRVPVRQRGVCDGPVLRGAACGAKLAAFEPQAQSIDTFDGLAGRFDFR